MNIAIIFLTAVANIVLQSLSRNMIYGYVFFAFTMGAMAIDVYTQKFGKFFMALVFSSYAALLSVCIYNQIVYNVPLFDYILVFTETIIVIVLTLIAILPIKKPRQSKSVGVQLFLK